MHDTTPPDVPAFPQLDPGVTMLQSESATLAALHSLVLDHLFFNTGDCYWVDANGRASTTSFARLAPSTRVLDRVNVARAFTAFQHYSLVESLCETLPRGDDTPSLVVAPCIDWFYAQDDLSPGEGEEMFATAHDELASLAATHEIPVLTSSATSTLGETVAERSDRTLECHDTRFGPRFVGEEFETLVFEQHDGVQTTLAFWKRVLEQRYVLAPSARTPTEVVTRGSN